MSAWRWMVLATFVGLVARVLLGATSAMAFPLFRAPSVCGSAWLPNADRIDIELWGPRTNVWYVPAGSPSNASRLRTSGLLLGPC